MTETHGETPTTARQRSERLHQLAHDLYNCLHIIESALLVLKSRQVNANELNELYDVIEKQRKAATALIGEFLDAACEADASRAS